jgi:hypothetical protein
MEFDKRIMTRLNSLKSEIVRLADITVLRKEFDRVALPRIKKLFGQPKVVGKPRRGNKKSSSKKNSKSNVH